MRWWRSGTKSGRRSASCAARIDTGSRPGAGTKAAWPPRGAPARAARPSRALSAGSPQGRAVHTSPAAAGTPGASANGSDAITSSSPFPLGSSGCCRLDGPGLPVLERPRIGEREGQVIAGDGEAGGVGDPGDVQVAVAALAAGLDRRRPGNQAQAAARLGRVGG